jgi:hypothetical protein
MPLWLPSHRVVASTKFLDKAQLDAIDTILAVVARRAAAIAAGTLGVVPGGMVHPHQSVVSNHASKWPEFKL